ncbi:haloacid dehalogenase type II [Pseudahrensia aquimaris]|uniref:(S)-2-haloacid dehalogenase n=1 Tax=Pseudahrensia aquimaris TaxID=744461 RepID=A0ABW3FF32_9HYPH
MSVPRAFIFDVFGTMVDWRESVAREAARAFSAKAITTDPYAFADFWRGRYDPAMERIRSGGRGYVQLDDLHRENLDETLAHFKLEPFFNEQERDTLNTAWEKLDPWPDVVDGLHALKAKAIIAPCSNGSIALMTRLAKYGGLPWDCILGAEIAQNYKPEPVVYHACCNALRLQPNEVMMVAAHNNDLHAAQACGLQTAFIARPIERGPGQTIDLAPNGDWDRVIDRISDLAH